MREPPESWVERTRCPEFCPRCGQWNEIDEYGFFVYGEPYITEFDRRQAERYGEKLRYSRNRGCVNCGHRGKTEANRPYDGRHVDFLGRMLKVGDYIIYTTGGQSARLVIAIVKRLEWTEHDFMDGHRRRTYAIIFVNRQREGEHTGAEDEEKWYRIDTKKEVRIEQLHRVVIIPKSLGRAATR